MRERIETRAAIVAAVNAHMNRAQEMFLDRAAAMGTSGLDTLAIRAQAPAGGSDRLAGRAVGLKPELLNLGHSGHAVEIGRASCRERVCSVV